MSDATPDLNEDPVCSFLAIYLTLFSSKNPEQSKVNQSIWW
jgi:hypothetical protein